MPPTDPALHDDYRRAGFLGHLAFGQRPALLVVDVVEAYLQPHSPLYADSLNANFETARDSVVRLIAASRAASVPVIYTCVAYQADGADGGLFTRKVPALAVFAAGAPLGRFPPQIVPRADEVVLVKQYASAFFGTVLASMLTARGIDTVLIGGFSTSGCVRATALDALQHGFAPFVVREACGDRAAAPHEASLFDLAAKYAEVIHESAAIKALGLANSRAKT
jgi:maleamate amidohydrolase